MNCLFSCLSFKWLCNWWRESDIKNNEYLRAKDDLRAGWGSTDFPSANSKRSIKVLRNDEKYL